MPGSGKTTVTKSLSLEFNLAVISTDKVFDEARANFSHPATKKYLETFEQVYGAPPDLKVIPGVADFIEKHGNTAFRDLEEQVLVAAFKAGTFDNALPDLGGSAFLREPTRAALSDKGIVSVYMEVPREMIAENLHKDYLECKKTGKISRGNYYRQGEIAESKGLDPKAALDAFSEEQRVIRTSFYEMADTRVTIARGDSVQIMAEKVKAALKTAAPRAR